MAEISELMALQEAARFLGVSRSSLLRLERKGISGRTARRAGTGVTSARPWPPCVWR